MITYDIHNKPPMNGKIIVKPLHMNFTAVQIDHDFWLDTPFHQTRGYSGDYILISDEGFMMIVRQNQFKTNFQEIKI